MKKLLVLFALAATFSACHYGEEEAKKTLNTNELYKGDKAEFSVNRANVEAGDATVAMPADSAAKDSSTTK
ncbi:MAG: hypothetical protein H7296_08220 [Bacteroidia bacterium]|nr:hypothetical protein [Bacteroidia bacterium]